MKFSLIVDDSKVDAVMQALDTIDGVESIETSFEEPLKRSKLFGLAGKQRVSYEVASPIQASRTLASLGYSTVKGKVFAEVLNATVSKRPINARAILNSTSLVESSVQKALFELKQDSIIRSVHL